MTRKKAPRIGDSLDGPFRLRGIWRSYPYREAEDIDDALKYAACLAEEEAVEFAR